MILLPKYFYILFALFFLPYNIHSTLANTFIVNDSLSSSEPFYFEYIEDSLVVCYEINDDSLCQPDIINPGVDSLIFVPDRSPKIGMAVCQGVFVNSLVWSVDKWILKRPYCSTGWKTLKDNINKGFVWDCDALSTNFVDHPYHGAQYYNAARINGLKYTYSSLLTLLGSLEWEELAETDFPAPNDLFSTTLGGTALGEVMYRMSNIILNNRDKRLKRLGKELLNTVVNPTYGVNRLLYGESWRIDEQQYLYHDKNEIPYDISISLGGRWDGSNYQDSRSNVAAQIRINYGNWTDLKHNSPFDQFITNVTLNPPAYHIPYFSDLNINARLHGWHFSKSKNYRCLFSINQDFTYLNNEKEERFKGNKSHLLHLAEPSSFGPAFYLETPCFKHLSSLNLSFIGAYTSDYYYRDYNMGSGFNFKTFNNLSVGRIVNLSLDAGFHFLFTWKGYEKDQIKKLKSDGMVPPYSFSLRQSRKAGDHGFVSFFVINPRIDIHLFSNIFASAMAKFCFRNSIYSYHDNVKARYKELFFSLTYKIQ